MIEYKTVENATTNLKRELLLEAKSGIKNFLAILPLAIAFVVLINLPINIFIVVSISGDFSILEELKTTVEIFLYLTPFSIIMTYILEGRSYRRKRKAIRNAKRHFEIINELIEEQAPFILYLYYFKSGEDSIYMKMPPVAGTSGEYYIVGNHRREAITKKLHKFIPIVYLYNSKELNYSYKGFGLIVEDESWLESFKVLFKHAKYVVVDYQTGFKNSENIKIEINYILEEQTGKVLYVGTKNEFAELLELYPDLDKKIIGSFNMIVEKTHSSFYGNLSKEFFVVDKSDSIFDKIKAFEL